MPVHSGSFNKRRVSATKERKIRERVDKKRQASKQNHNIKKLAVSGRRTGMAMLDVMFAGAAAKFTRSSCAFFLRQEKQRRSCKEHRRKH